MQELAQHLGPAGGLVRNQPKEGEQAPFIEGSHRQASKGAPATPERIKAQIHPMMFHRDDFALEKRLRVFGKRSEEISDDRWRSRQGPETLAIPAGAGQADCARRSANARSGPPRGRALAIRQISHPGRSACPAETIGASASPRRLRWPDRPVRRPGRWDLPRNAA